MTNLFPAKSSVGGLAFRVEYKASVERDLKKIDKQTTERLLHKLEQTLSNNPSAGEPLGGEFRSLWKYRIGDYRAIYTKIPGGILILRISHRREVYRRV